MVSRRNFFSIIVMMAVLLFMFQFSQVIKENDSDFDINTYALEESVPNDPKWRPDVMENGNFVVFCGSEDGAVYPVAEGLGCGAIRVTSREEMGPALEKAIAMKAPVLIECVIPEDDKVFPMVPAGAPIAEVFDGDDL